MLHVHLCFASSLDLPHIQLKKILTFLCDSKMEIGQKRPLINTLTQGKEFTNQLKTHLDKPMSAETCDFLVEKILSSYEKALSMLNPTTACFGQITDVSASPSSCNKNVFKKRQASFMICYLIQVIWFCDFNLICRKTMAKWSEQVKVCSGSMVEGPLGDGYSWRKYGQKDILGANHPRAYYRCTHRHVQGCLATKQVQRSDEDPSVFGVIYKGRHTCIESTRLSEKKPKKEKEIIQDIKPTPIAMATATVCLDRVFSFKGGVNEEGLFPSFLFASTPIETEKLENFFYLGCDSTAFNPNLQTSDSDLSEMINSASNSATNSPLVDLDFSLDHGDFDGNFGFDITDSEMFV